MTEDDEFKKKDMADTEEEVKMEEEVLEGEELSDGVNPKAEEGSACDATKEVWEDIKDEFKEGEEDRPYVSLKIGETIESFTVKEAYKSIPKENSDYYQFNLPLPKKRGGKPGMKCDYHYVLVNEHGKTFRIASWALLWGIVRACGFKRETQIKELVGYTLKLAHPAKSTTEKSGYIVEILEKPKKEA